MDIQKANWSADGELVKFVMQISKVDEERRLVSGFASLNNIDKQDQVVTEQCSAEAFSAFRGNIREMHQPIAAGHLVNFSQAPYYDVESDATYQGIYVEAYVSKGAEPTWIKVLDGTLTGFSIGGRVQESHSEYVPELNKTITFITKMTLHELSLVDNPANQFANVLSIQKNEDGLVAKGIATEVTPENVFWCETDGTARASADESADCAKCGDEMQNIGWFEFTSEKTLTSDLKKFVDNWAAEKVITAQQIKEQTSETVSQNSEFANEENVGDNDKKITEKSEGGVNVSDTDNVEKAADVEEVEATAAEEVVEKAEEAPVEVEETVEKAEETVEEPVVEEDAVAKAADDFKAFVEEALAKSVAANSATLESITGELEEMKKSIAVLSEIAKTSNDTKESVDKINSKVANLEKATAIKKSGDDDSSEQIAKEFSWDGHFASASSILN